MKHCEYEGKAKKRIFIDLLLQFQYSGVRDRIRKKIL